MKPTDRVPVQGDGQWWSQWDKTAHPPGTITWEEHYEVWKAYDAKWRCGQSAERIAERGGFGYQEAMDLLGRPLVTWVATPKRGTE